MIDIRVYLSSSRALVGSLALALATLSPAQAADTLVETSKVEAQGTSGLGGRGTLDRDTLAANGRVFDRSSDGVEGWGQVADFTFSPTPIAIDGDYLVEKGAGGLNVRQRDLGGANAWGLVATLVASDEEPLDLFGRAVDIDGDTVVAGSAKDDDGGINSGSAYVFQRDHGGLDAWGEVAKLTASDAMPADWFGDAVAIEGDTVIVAAPRHDDHDGTSNRGAIYVFERDAGGPDAWGELTETIPSRRKRLGDDGALDLSGDVAIASTFIFERDEGGADSWGEVAELAPSDPQDFSLFGDQVSVQGNLAVVGASTADDGPNANAGVVYLFERSETSSGQGVQVAWTEVLRLTPSDGEAGDQFGSMVKLSAGSLAVGAEGFGLADKGAVYVFDFAGPVGGKVFGIDPERLVCRNLTQGTSLAVTLSTPSWDCEALGLAADSGDRLFMRVVGAINGVEPVGATVLGQVNRKLLCDNRTLGNSVNAALGGATVWNCENEGLPVAVGDTVHQVIRGEKR